MSIRKNNQSIDILEILAWEHSKKGVKEYLIGFTQLVKALSPREVFSDKGYKQYIDIISKSRMYTASAFYWVKGPIYYTYGESLSSMSSSVYPYLQAQQEEYDTDLPDTEDEEEEELYVCFRPRTCSNRKLLFQTVRPRMEYCAGSTRYFTLHVFWTGFTCSTQFRILYNYDRDVFPFKAESLGEYLDVLSDARCPINLHLQ